MSSQDWRHKSLALFSFPSPLFLCSLGLLMSRVLNHIVRSPKNKLIKNTHSVSSFFCFLSRAEWVCVLRREHRELQALIRCCCSVVAGQFITQRAVLGTPALRLSDRDITKTTFYSPLPLGVQGLPHGGPPTAHTQEHTHVQHVSVTHSQFPPHIMMAQISD